jgi:hypothetical protein
MSSTFDDFRCVVVEYCVSPAMQTDMVEAEFLLTSSGFKLIEVLAISVEMPPSQDNYIQPRYLLSTTTYSSSVG